MEDLLYSWYYVFSIFFFFFFFEEDGWEVFQESLQPTVATLDLEVGIAHKLLPIAVDYVGNSEDVAHVDYIEVYVPVPEGKCI